MPKALAFFPWVSVEEPISVGSIRLLPYQRGKRPGDLPHVSQADMDAIVGAYAVRKDNLVEQATLLEVHEWHAGQETSKALEGEFFKAQELIGFSALAKRRLFRGHVTYCNFDDYALTVQHFTEGSAGTFSFSTRRRDGGQTLLWTSSDFAFFKPLHAKASEEQMSFDAAFLNALVEAVARDVIPMDAIVEFNRANTDSDRVPKHIELVMMKSAYESFFDIAPEAPDLVRAVCACVTEGEQAQGAEWVRWRARWQHSSRPLAAWASEFSAIRSGGAHGQKRGREGFVWLPEAHLAFASILFPLLVRQRLVERKLLEADERAEIELSLVEKYLLANPFLAPDDSGPVERLSEHAWSRIYSEDVLGEVLRRGLHRTVKEALKEQGHVH